MRQLRISSESLVLALLAVAVLWKGGKGLELVWLQAMVAGAVALFSLCRRNESVPVRPLFAWMLLVLGGWTVVSYFFSSTRNYGFDEVLQTVSLLLLCLWSAAEVRKNSGFPAQFAKVLSVVTLLACGIGLVVYSLQPVSRFVGTFFDYRFHTDYWPNAWAEYLLFAWPVLVWVLFLRQSKRLPTSLNHDWIKAAVVGFVFGCLALSYSRGGSIAFFGQLVLLGSVLAHVRSTLRWQRIFKVAVVAAIAAALTFAGANALRSQLHHVESAAKKLTFSSAEGASSVTERRQFWAQSTSIALDHPIFGSGPYSFRFIQPHLQSEVLATSDHPHNVFLKYASERGVIAALLLAAILAWSLISVVPPVLSRTRKTDPLGIRSFLVLGIAGVIAHNLIDYNLQFVAVALPVWMAIGMLASVPEKQKAKGCRAVVAIIAFILLFFTVYEGTNLFLSSRARHAEARGDVYEALKWYSWLDASVFPRDARLSQGAILLGLHQLPQAEDAVSKYLLLNDSDGRAWRMLGDIYLKWGKRNDALRAYDKAYQSARYNDAGILRGLVYLQEDVDRDVLVSRRPEFDSLLNDFGLAVQENTHFIVLSSGVEEMISLCDLMAQYFPQDAQLYRSLARRIAEHAKEERARYSSRPRGFLW